MTWVQHATEGDAFNGFNNRARELGLSFDTDLGIVARLASAMANFTLPDSPAGHYYVDTVRGAATNNGLSWTTAFSTMALAASAVQTGGTIHFTGDVREEIDFSNLKFDVTVIGHGSLHHADLPAAGYNPGAAVWRPPATPTATTALAIVRGRGWKFYNIFFDCPVDAAAIRLMTGTGAGLTEDDANHASIFRCDFRNGLYGIQDNGGCFNVTVDGCVFETLDATSSAAGIRYLTTINAPRRWRITNNYFQGDSTTEGNERHIVSPLNGSLIRGNVFGTVKGTGKYIDLTGGAGNVVADNIFGGVYDTDDYVAGTGDLWLQNSVAVVAVTAPDGRTLAAPAAP